MAIKRLLRMANGEGVTFELFMEYDPDDSREINDKGEPDDFRVIRWFGTNYSADPLKIELKLGHGPDAKSWKQETIAAGESFTQFAGGRVKYQYDIPEWRYG